MKPSEELEEVLAKALVEERNEIGSAEEELDALVELPPFKRTNDRIKETANKLNISPTDVRKELQRRERQSREEQGKGRGVELKEFTPLEEFVDGHNLLSDIADAVKERAVVTDYQADAIALWVVHTHAYEQFPHTPRLLVTAPEEECGKTRLMSHVVGAMAPRPLFAELMTPAPFFRLAEQHKPVFLIDEVDAFLKEDSTLIAALNQGYEPHGTVFRCVGEDQEVRTFRPHCPVAMAGIRLLKKLRRTLVSRSIVIELSRALPEELRALKPANAQDEQLTELGRRIATWVQSKHDDLGKPPKLGLTGREADKWAPLARIAELAGGEWPDRCRKALEALSASEQWSQTLSQELLSDIYKILGGRDRIWTQDLIDALCRDPERPWANYNFRAKGDEQKITDRQLAKLLEPYGVGPEDVRIGSNVKRGYKRKRFEEAFRRYLGPEDTTPLQPSHEAQYAPTEHATTDDDVARGTPERVSNDASCSGVADSTPFPEDAEESKDDDLPF